MKNKKIIYIVGGIIIACMIGIIAVSYTHLDVYKRQVLSLIVILVNLGYIVLGMV